MPEEEGIGTWPTPEMRIDILRWIREVEERLRKIREILEGDEPREKKIKKYGEKEL